MQAGAHAMRLVGWTRWDRGRRGVACGHAESARVGVRKGWGRGLQGSVRRREVSCVRCATQGRDVDARMLVRIAGTQRRAAVCAEVAGVGAFDGLGSGAERRRRQSSAMIIIIKEDSMCTKRLFQKSLWPR